MDTSAEHLVVGSGAGGAVTAAALAEAGRDVLVLEEGPWVEQDEVEPFSLTQMARQYRQGGVAAALGRPPVAYAEGRCAGGSTEINSGLYHLAPPETLARWRRTHAVDGLTPDALAPFEEETRADLSVQQLPGPAPPASQKLADGAERLGWEAVEVPRWFRYDQGRPVKQTMTRTYLPRARAAGGRVETDVRVERLLLRRDRVAGAMTSQGLVTAEHVWLCAGAIGTPSLLQRSGIKRGVGHPLQMHPMAKVVARFSDPINLADDVPMHQVKPLGSEMTFGGSASRPGLIALSLADDWAANRAAAEDWRHMGVYYASIRPAGRGRVVALPGLREPLVTYLLTRADMAQLERGMQHLVWLMLAGGATAVYPSVAGGGAVTRAEDAGRVRVTRAGTSVMSVHLFSSLPLGEAEHCPVDSYGNLRGVRGLRVNDASLLPDAPGVNPQGTVMAIARRNVAAYLAS